MKSPQKRITSHVRCAVRSYVQNQDHLVSEFDSSRFCSRVCTVSQLQSKSKSSQYVRRSVEICPSVQRRRIFFAEQENFEIIITV